MSEKDIHVSHSKLKELACPRAYQHSYPMNLESVQPKKALVLGNAFHRGLEAALAHSTTVDATYEERGYVILATATGHDYIDSQAAQFEDPNDGTPADMKATISAMFRAYIPELQINKRWRVAKHYEVFPCSNCGAEGFEVCDVCGGGGVSDVASDGQGRPTEVGCEECDGAGDLPCTLCSDGQHDKPMLEYYFDVHIRDGIYARGVIDAVLYDMENEEFVAIDWKTMTSPRTIEELVLDSQVHVYVAVLQHLGASIDTLAMWEFAKTPPQPAKVTPAKGAIAKGAQKSTWEVWYNSLSPEHKVQVDSDLSTWETWADAKLHPMTDFSNYLEDYLSPKAASNMLDNLVAQGQYIRYIEENELYPAINNAGYGGKCKGCTFRTLCAGVYRYGDDPAPVIAKNYRQKSWR